MRTVLRPTGTPSCCMRARNSRLRDRSPTATDTLGFRWSGVHNLFLTQGDFGADEWRAARCPDEDNAEKELRQFVWCIPVAPTKQDETTLRAEEIAARTLGFPRGLVPPTAERLTAAIDLGKYLTHWIVVAWSPGATCHVVDYGRIEVASEDLGIEQAVLVALRQFRDLVKGGWPIAEGKEGEVLHPQAVWIDSGYLAPVVYSFCRESGTPYVPAIGRGTSQQRAQHYNRPTSTGAIVRRIGEGYHLNWLPSERLQLAEMDADYWKSWAHQRLVTPTDKHAALTLFKAPALEYLSLAKHLTAERKTEEFVAGKGVVTRWERIRRANHWFDTLYNACAAGHSCGVRLMGDAPRRPRITLSQLQQHR